MADVFLITNTGIAGIFWSVIIVIIVPFLVKQLKQWLFIILLGIVLISAYMLLLSNSRTGWFACSSALAYFVYCNNDTKRKKRWILPIASLLSLFLIALIFYRANSSAGRKHIYSISIKMFASNWVTGIGPGKFKTSFNEYQADYFSHTDIDSKRALFADNTFFAFNDYLQWSIETGLPGLLLLAATLFFLARRIRLLQNEYKSNRVVTAAASGMICIATASLFSYPMQIWQIQLLALVLAGIIIFFPLKNGKTSFISKTVIASIRCLYLTLACFFVFTNVLVIKRKIMEKDTFKLAMAGYKSKAIERYRTLSNYYPVNGHNSFLLAQQLYYSNRLDEALSILVEARKNYVDNEVYRLKGQIENELGKYEEAEKSYLRTIYMVPNRMGSRFDLMKFYLERSDTLKAINWAKSILSMQVKVPSERTENMLKETKEILNKLGN